ncbi:MAG: hypothetical protein V3T84_05115 [Phycisphaerales bacterium]
MASRFAGSDVALAAGTDQIDARPPAKSSGQFEAIEPVRLERKRRLDELEAKLKRLEAGGGGERWLTRRRAA